MTGYYKKEIDDLDSKINELTMDQDKSFVSSTHQQVAHAF